MKKAPVRPVDHSLPIDEDLQLFGLGKKVQHAGWVVMLILLVMSGLGVFGSGVVSNRKSTSGPSSIDYEEFLRYEFELELIVRARVDTTHVLVSFPKEYLSHFRLEQINPMPQSYHFSGPDIVYTFLAGTSDVEIHFYFTPEKVGVVDGVATVHGHRIPLHHFIYP
jgi:hypothetical protein